MEDALPSSPPLAPTRPPLTRKRTRASELSMSCPSSDPAFFSSDDLNDEGAENYNGDRPRKKVQWDGAWWGHGEPREGSVSSRTRAARNGSRKKAFARNVDSGVWMASDDSESTTPDVETVVPVSSSVVVVEPVITKRRPRLEVEVLVERKILDAAYHPPAHVDLTDLQLECLDGELLLPLQTLVAPAPHLDAAGSSSPRVYAPLTPEIHLYLSNNKLSYLPFQIFDLEHLTVLSLRNNNLSELSSLIGRLRNLQTLNVTGNKLRYLPSNLLPLLLPAKGGIEHFERWSNPLVNPVAVVQESWNYGWIDVDFFIPHSDDPMHEDEQHQSMQDSLSPQLRNWTQVIRTELRERWTAYRANAADLDSNQAILNTPIVVASTPITYFDPTGIPVNGIPLSEMTDAQIVASLDKPTCDLQAPSSTPSLFEHCLRMCAASSELPHLASMMPAEAASTIMNGLKAAETAARDGAGICSSCNRSFVLARAEWIDFVFSMMNIEFVCDIRDIGLPRSLAPSRINFDEIMVPFIYRVCSWPCAERRRKQLWR